VGLSILLFICILLAWKLGYIQPTGLPVGQRIGKAAAGPNKKSALRRFFCGCGAYIQYTSMYRPSQTTSTKCQYQAAPSKPKCLSA
jgi:hypothetical protein